MLNLCWSGAAGGKEVCCFKIKHLLFEQSDTYYLLSLENNEIQPTWNNFDNDNNNDDNELIVTYN